MRACSLPAGTMDFHAHILPGVDHGSPGLATSQAQWKLLRAAGISAVVATPHFYAHEVPSVEAFLEKRDEAARLLLASVPADSPTLYLGAEVLVSRGIEDLPELSSLCIKGTRVILLEMPLGGWSSDLYETLSRIADRGLIPLMAHIDRYPLSLLEELYADRRFLYQVNLGSVLGLGGHARYFRRMLRAGAVAALGSDLHGIPKRGYDRYLRAFRRIKDDLAVVNEHTEEILKTAIPCVASL